VAVPAGPPARLGNRPTPVKGCRKGSPNGESLGCSFGMARSARRAATPRQPHPHVTTRHVSNVKVRPATEGDYGIFARGKSSSRGKDA
jgi:hypothetical protein